MRHSLVRSVLRPAVPALAAALAVIVVLFPVVMSATPIDMASMSIESAYAQAVGTYNPTPIPTCSPNSVPVGQANPPGNQLEPLAPIWCFNLNPPNSPGFVSGANDWTDTFDEVAQYGRFADHDYGYRVFDNVQNGGTAHTQHFTNNGHWMDDNAGGFQGGTMLRPDRSFTMENVNGVPTIVVEHDFAAGISGYADSSGGDVAWGEITITDGPTPNNPITDGLYAYGRFGGFDAFGCRIHALRKFTCSYEAKRGGANGLDTGPCFEFSPDRLIELSGFEYCGNVHSGFDQFSSNAQYFRQCNSLAQEPDMNCRDRFRMELTHTSLKVYVNGALYGQDLNWPARNQIPATWGTASDPLYVYFSDWEVRPTAPAYRFHWDQMRVNPHNADGTFAAPSAAPNFCLGQPNNTCMAGMPTATAVPPTLVPPTPVPPTPVPPTPVPPTPVPQNTPPTSTSVPATPIPSTPTPTRTAAPPAATPTNTVVPPRTLLVGSNVVQPDVDSNSAGMAEAFQYTAAATGKLANLYVYVDRSSTAQQLVVGLYTNTNRRNHPSSLLTGGVINSVTPGAWNSVTVPSVQVSAGTRYWLAILGPAGGGTPAFRDQACCSGRSETSLQTKLSVLPTTWSSGTQFADSPASMYATP